MAGAFFGAAVAYVLAVVNQRRKTQDQRHQAVLEAQIVILKKIRLLRSFKNSTSNISHDLHFRHVRNHALPEPPSWNERVDLRSLVFLLSVEKKNANLIYQLSRADDFFEMFVYEIRLRNDAVEKLKSALNSADPSAQRHEQLLKQITDSMYSTLDTSIILTAEAYSALLSAAIAAFKRPFFFSRRRIFLTYGFDE